MAEAIHKLENGLTITEPADWGKKRRLKKWVKIIYELVLVPAAVLALMT